MLEDYVLSTTHFILSSILLFIAARAYLRTKLPSIFYFTLGFAIIAVGHLFYEIYFHSDVEVWRFDEIFDILAFIAFIVAVKKS